MKHARQHTLASLGALLIIWLLVGPAEAGRILHVSQTQLPNVSPDSQYRSITAAVIQVQPGDTIMIHTGTYREGVVISTNGTKAAPIVFEAAPGANVVVTGADQLTGWQKEPGPDNIFSIPWTYSFQNNRANHTHPEDDYHLLIGRTEQVIVNNYLLRQVLTRSQLARGTFFADLDNKRLYVWDAANRDISGGGVEGSTRESAWNCTGAYVETRGIIFRYAANAAQSGGAEFSGQGDVIRGCTFEWMNGAGVRFEAPDQHVYQCTIQNNGQLGFAAVKANNMHMSYCVVQNNDVKDFDGGWEAGGNKTALTRGAVIDHCQILNNHVNGLWFDIGNENCDVHNCLIADNADMGLYTEISYGLHAHDNVIIGNGFGGNSSWASSGGITIYTTPNCVVERNLVIGNAYGFNFKDQADRTTPRIGGSMDKGVIVSDHDEIVDHNVFADNDQTQLWGFFDDVDDRQWPKNLQAPGGYERPGYMSQADLEKHIAADTALGVPTGLDLKKLNIIVDHNIYSAPDGQGVFNWGTTWLQHRTYPSLAGVRKDLGFEQNGTVAPVVFGDLASHDFRVPANSPVLKMGCYPQGTVPGVKLGVLPTSGTAAD